MRKQTKKQKDAEKNLKLAEKLKENLKKRKVWQDRKNGVSKNEDKG